MTYILLEHDLHILKFALVAGFFGILLSFFIRFLFLNNKTDNFLYQLFFLGSYSLYTFLQSTINKKNISNSLFSKIFFLAIILLLYNLLVLIPFMEEPTQDLNVTIACGIFAFFIIHLESFKLNRDKYLHHWLKTPINYVSVYSYFKNKIVNISIFIGNMLITLIMLPLELLSRFSLILSLSFRLYGNIFGGATIAYLLKSFMLQSWVYQCLGIFSGLQLIVMLFFGLLEGAIQAFIFVLISVNNIGLLISED